VNDKNIRLFCVGEEINMTHTHFVTGTLLSITLFAAPMANSADEQPLPTDADKQAITVVHDGDVNQDDAHGLAGKRARSPERVEGIDCFYEENKAEKDCRDSKDSAR
jgi:predicted outer membrane protein